jgi:hypothetical protein
MQINNYVELRAACIALLSTLLGEYHYKDSMGNTASIPAIWKVNDTDIDPPADHKAQGIECLIYPPQPRGDPLFGDKVVINENWLVKLIQHDRSKPLGDAAKLLIKAWPNASINYLRKSNEINEQVIFTILSWEII